MSGREFNPGDQGIHDQTTDLLDGIRHFEVAHLGVGLLTPKTVYGGIWDGLLESRGCSAESIEGHEEAVGYPISEAKLRVMLGQSFTRLQLANREDSELSITPVDDTAHLVKDRFNPALPHIKVFITEPSGEALEIGNGTALVKEMEVARIEYYPQFAS